MKQVTLLILATIILTLVCASPASAQWEEQEGIRLGSISTINGPHKVYLKGMALVTGLNGTGDKGSLAKKAIKSITKKITDISVNPKDIQSKNVAVVWVTAILPPFAKKGDVIDIKMASLFDCSSLRGGHLIGGPLSGPRTGDDTVYAWALSERIEVSDLHPTTGQIRRGATVLQELDASYHKNGSVIIKLNEASLSTAVKVAETINEKYLGRTYGELDPLYPRIATAQDEQNIEVKIPATYTKKDGTGEHITTFLASLQAEWVKLVKEPKVIVKESENILIITGNVRISKSIISADGITLKADPENNVFENDKLAQITDDARNLEKISRVLNNLNVPTSTVIKLLKGLDEAGALHAKLEIKE